MDRKQIKFIKDLENKSVQEIAQYIYQGGISWEELIYNSAGRFSMVKQRQTLVELEKLKTPIQPKETDKGNNLISNNNTYNQNYSYDNSLDVDDLNDNYNEDGQDYSTCINNTDTEEYTNPGVNENTSDNEEIIETPRVAKVEVSQNNDSIFSYKGRMGRLKWFGIGILIYILSELMVVGIGVSYADIGLVILCFLLGIPMIWVSICVNSKRCHDIGWSGWCQLIPLIGLLLLFWPGEDIDNEYGPAKK